MTPPALLTGWDAADAYIAERESTARKAFDIVKHERYTGGARKGLRFAGLRFKGEQGLALLQDGETILVMPVDALQAARLRRLPLRTQLDVGADGAVKKSNQLEIDF